MGFSIFHVVDATDVTAVTVVDVNAVINELISIGTTAIGTANQIVYFFAC